MSALGEGERPLRVACGRSLSGRGRPVPEYGVSLIEFAQTQRLLLAKRFLTDTRLPVTTVALAAGFGCVRRFNDLFLKQYGLNPLRFRKQVDSHPQETITFSLGYRPPFSWSGVLEFLAQRQIDGVEQVSDNSYARAIELRRGSQNIAGWISVTHAPQRYAIDVELSISLLPVIAQVRGRVRRMFDLSARSDLIDMHLGDLAAELPGMRVPQVV